MEEEIHTDRSDLRSKKLRTNLPDTSIARVTRREVLGVGGGLVIGAAAAALGLSAFSPGVPTTATTTVTQTAMQTATQTVVAATTAAPQATIVALAAYLDVDFYIPIKASVADAASMFNVNFKLTGVPGGDYHAFADIFSATIAQKPDGIIIEEADPSLFPLTKQSISQGIPVVSWIVDDANTLSDPHPSGRLAYIGTDQHSLGLQLANDVLPAIQALSPPAKAEAAIFIQRPGAPDLEQRAQGYKDVLGPAGFTITEHLAGPETVAQSESLVESYLISHPGVVAAFGCDGISSPGVGEAINKLNLKSKVVGAGFDLIPENLTAVQQGNLLAVANQQPYITLPQAVFTLLATKLSNGLIAPWSSLTGASVVDQKNVANFYQNASSKYVGAK
jgi:ribose transport system substrate-binding protein